MPTRIARTLIALAAALAACGDPSMPNRAEIDCFEDGAVCWQELPSSEGMDWYTADEYCATLAFGGLSWRLPTIDELRGLVAGCDGVEPGGACPVTEGCLDLACATADCAGCGTWGGPGDSGCYWDSNVEGSCYCYWSGSEATDSATSAWYVAFDSGALASSAKGSAWCNARCVTEGED